MTTRSGQLLVAKVASDSRPGFAWEVAWDGEALTCPCPAWTRRTHYRGCLEAAGAGACNCKRRGDLAEPKSRRTCPHVRRVRSYCVDYYGDVASAVRMLQRGYGSGLAVDPSATGLSSAAEQDRIRREQQRLARLPQAGVGSAPAARRTAPPPSQAPRSTQADATPWLGGGRAITLRD